MLFFKCDYKGKELELVLVWWHNELNDGEVDATQCKCLERAHHSNGTTPHCQVTSTSQVVHCVQLIPRATSSWKLSDTCFRDNRWVFRVPGATQCNVT